jgi:crossover junction endodeoxyribonuclease RuvC
MRILGIDPGTQVVGYGCLDLVEALPVHAASLPMALRVGNLARAGGERPVFVAAGALRLGPRGASIAQRLHRLSELFRELLVELAPGGIALEEAYFGKSVQAALRIGEARGVILAEAARAGVEVQQFSPARIKRSVAGSGAASKLQVARMVAHSLRLDPIPEPADVTDALAVGLCAVEARRTIRA